MCNVTVNLCSNTSLICTCTMQFQVPQSEEITVGHVAVKWGILWHGKGILWAYYTSYQSHPKRIVWRFAHADWQRANNLIEETDWQSLITGEVDTSWNNWQNRFLEIARQCVPHRRLPPCHNLPWLSKSLVQLMRRRSMLFICLPF